MCGICGIVHSDPGRTVDRDVLRAMNREIVHRGPDDEGLFVEGNVGLAMRRLSIIDLFTGHQPISNEDGTIVIVYNGEIYNHSELRCEMEARGHRYSTHSDTETIVHLFEQYGQDCVQHLRGMFAFALWDGKRQMLFAARDRLGIKPLYYRFAEGSFLFGSEIKALLAFPGVRPELNRDILPEYLAFGYISGRPTFFQGIDKLPPGHTLRLQAGSVPQIEPYWDLRMDPNEEVRPASYYAQAYRERLEETVASHLMSDVPLGVFLSGGIDSSAVAAITARKCSEPIKTFSVGYGEQAHSELPYARAVAQHLGSDHHEVLLSREQFFAALPSLIWHEDEPITWPSSVALFFVAQLARKHVTVVLTGEGSDETLGGYGRYALTLWNARMDGIYRGVIPAGMRRFMREVIAGGALGATMRRRLEHTFLGRNGASWPSFYFDNFYAAFSADEQRSLLEEPLCREASSAYSSAMAVWEKSSGDLLGRLLYTDIKTYLVELLMKQDNMSMAASVESRVPFLDHRLVEFAAEIPRTYLTSGFSGKMVLKSAVKDLLPKSILYRKKMGFPTPWSTWMAGPQLNSVESLLVEARSLQRRLFRSEKLRELVRQHRARSHDHADRLWRLLNLELWHRVFIDRERPSSKPVNSGTLSRDVQIEAG